MRASLPIALTLGLAGCGKAPPTTPAEPSPQPPSAASPSGAVNADAHVTTYRCDDGQTLEAGYPEAATAVVTVGGHAYSLRAALAASGARYVGYGLQWWTKGMTEGRLARLKPSEEVASDPGVTCRAAPSR
jgi:membrane-bound inhibitor of C-type lysozyme